ncbi:MAG: PKD domain-containing protein, partial [Ilumatobacteraceae bacterium]
MGTRLDRTTTTTIAIGAISLLASACSGSSSADGPTEPRVDDLQVVVNGREAVVVADVADDDGDLASVVVEWGDDAEESVESGFPGLRVDHTYSVAGSYTVIVQALDEQGNTAIETADVEIEIDDIDDAAAASTTTTEPPVNVTTPTVAPPSPTAPPTTRPTTPPPPPPPPPTTPPPPPPTTEAADPQPIEVDLLDGDLVYVGNASPDDNAGGSADVRQPAFNEIELHAEALTGYNGRGDAEGALFRPIETGGLFDDQRVTEIRV